MHIPSHMLQGAVCPMTLAVSVAGVGAAIYCCKNSDDKVSDIRWAGVSALIFVLHMLNFPVTDGTSGHLLGGVLAAALLGIPRAIISVAAVVFVQAVFFADGGLDALGANIMNMSLLGAGLGGGFMLFLQKRGLAKSVAVAFASFASVMIATLACTWEVAASGAIDFGAMARAMIPVHILIGIGEAALTVVLWMVLSRVLQTERINSLITRTVLCLLAALALTPLASSLPDGLEWAASQLRLTISEATPLFPHIQDYQIVAINSPYLSVWGAGFIGAVLVWFSIYGFGKIRFRFANVK
jgi:cobalt/nickel transport system permease protein